LRFLFYDRILEMEPGKHARAEKLVTLADEYFPEHYPRRPVMPGTLIMESLSQLAGWLNIVSWEFKADTVMVLVEGVRIHRQVRPGDLMTLETWMLYTHPDGSTIRGEVRSDKEIIAAVDRVVFANRKVTDEREIQRKREVFRYYSGDFPL